MRYNNITCTTARPFGYAAILISRFGYFSLISSSDIVRINELTLILKIIGQCSIKCYDKNDKVSFEGLDINYHKYHSSSYRNRSDSCDNACLDFIVYILHRTSVLIIIPGSY
jgi:hypothetical protein